ncbi:Methylcrotonyl-CoA carboxylase biotin-containing subunit [Candidatus Rhodobacter oscarellae]|uniref:Methylcrotonyl-CoA carboxylase biotin-containing subunit n=1 Tax=Candidatus Rhodobacter oscarellae TaxID=1675527 RepID=A0A0J9E1E3_9RHOB|nr:acetyl/propionyl/methylcrotonyl-CoA carboxylase subunit alpha [Candidatus Rhodobacter lobularis]KMW56507.1 Methylcrotonyl-CoA carboxylase biotin-containing subunit [Candidatus Rhodobacter lobularis]
MFDKILIANRGEIACRIIETCRQMGVGTVAVYSDADAGARHVALADQAVHIGAALPAESYLRGARIIQAALDSGAQAIHPGYGFLSENPDFVEAVEAAGLTFIGPSGQAIRAMGLKDAAKALMVEAGVPVVPGYHGAGQEDARLAAEADKIGYPVLIKAVAGGGGKGMRLVEAASEFGSALEAARAEAKGAFGNDAVLVEKFIQSPRHIEIQVFGDGTRAVHLFERDCSLQRRHQKVIEEAPAPGMPEAVRAAMGAAAVRAAEAIGYKGAGTVEFIVDGSGPLREDGFWFMEMNTRLQVEHPVTEFITGLDLVAWQLLVASGAPLPARQDELAIDGHAFEARLYAEDVPKGFLPATGRLTHLSFPAGARADTGVRAGDEISPYYDPMIAKVIVHGSDREHALQKLRQALATTQVAGTVTNLAFLRRLAAHPGFAKGAVDTGLIGRDLDALTQEPVPCSKSRALAALGALGLGVAPRRAAEGFALWQPMEHQARLDWRDEAILARVQCQGGGYLVRLDGGEAAHHIRREGEDWWIDGGKVSAELVVTGEGHVSVFWGNGYHFTVPDPLAVAAGDAAGGDVIEAPMPGLVKAVFVEAGQEVRRGDRLAVLEAMKMEHTLTAPRDGDVSEVLVATGAQVEAGAALIQLTEDDA